MSGPYVKALRDLPDVVAANGGRRDGVNAELTDVVGYCGLVCSICENQCPCKLDPKHGDEDCHQRKCCQEKGFEGCWECDDFPCHKGYLSEENEWHGLCIASIQCAREMGLAEYVGLCVANLGEHFNYSEFLNKTPEESLKRLRRTGK